MRICGLLFGNPNIDAFQFFSVAFFFFASNTELFLRHEPVNKFRIWVRQTSLFSAKTSVIFSSILVAINAIPVHKAEIIFKRKTTRLRRYYICKRLIA